MATTRRTKTQTTRSRKTWRVGEAATIQLPEGRARVVRGPDVDTITWRGERLREDRLAAIAQDAIAAHRRARGRPSLTGTAAHSPQVGFRVTPAMRARAERLAKRTGKSLSQLAREAFEALLQRTA